MLWLDCLLAYLAVTISLKSHHQANIPSRLHVRGCLKRCVHYIFVCVNVMFVPVSALLSFCVSLAPSLSLYLFYTRIYVCICYARLSRVSFALSHMDCIKLLSVCSRDSIMFHSQPPPHTHAISIGVVPLCFTWISLSRPSTAIATRPPIHSLTQLGCITKLKSVFVLLAFLFYVSIALMFLLFSSLTLSSLISEISLAIES